MRSRYQNVRALAAMLAFFLTVISVADANGQTGPKDRAASHLYFFTNDGCAPCRQVEPAIESLQRAGFPVTTIKLSDRPDWGQRFQVDRTPTVVLVTGDQIAGRHAGLIDLPTLKQWFTAVGQGPIQESPNPANLARAGAAGVANLERPVGTKVSLDQRAGSSSGSFSSATMHKGTAVAANELEQRALNATVRLKVEDPEGISYATGTVIHSRGGESLVLTCGHVFRDACGKGVITAEYGFADGQVLTAPGQLVSYDAESKDIGLVTIQTRGPIEPVSVAAESNPVTRGDHAFSVGCDHGQSPTIRRTAIKNRAAYDGSVKYDIYGRPVDGRSGGGLFNQRGELIGVCNAAAVEVDEGIYSALNTVYWQLAEVNLTHLFDGSQQLAAASDSNPIGDRFASTNAGRSDFASSLNDARQRSDLDADQNRSLARITGRGTSQSRQGVDRPSRTPVSYDRAADSSSQSVVERGRSDMEVIILVRSRNDPSRAEAITVSDPSDELLGYLAEMQAAQSQSRHLDVAQLRKRIEYPAK